MINLSLSHTLPVLPILPALPALSVPGAVALGLGTGLVIGAAMFMTLRWNGRVFASGRVLVAVAIQLTRLLVAAAGLIVLARFGAVALVASMGGILAMRTWALRRVMREVR